MSQLSKAVKDRRGYNKMAQWFARLLENHYELDFKRTWFRADGRTICPLCKMPYSKHPEVLSVFSLLCDGRLVKL